MQKIEERVNPEWCFGDTKQVNSLISEIVHAVNNQYLFAKVNQEHILLSTYLIKDYRRFDIDQQQDKVLMENANNSNPN